MAVFLRKRMNYNTQRKPLAFPPMELPNLNFIIAPQNVYPRPCFTDVRNYTKKYVITTRKECSICITYFWRNEKLIMYVMYGVSIKDIPLFICLSSSSMSNGAVFSEQQSCNLDFSWSQCVTYTNTLAQSHPPMY